MACRFDEEFNPWPSFVDIFSSVILVLLLFLLVVLANLGYYAQFKYKVSYTGSVSTDELILQTSTTSENRVDEKTPIGYHINPNSNLNIQVYKEEKQMVLALQNQITADESHVKSAEGTDEVVSAGINVADKPANDDIIQTSLSKDDYFIITYKADELFVDDNISRQLKDFLAKAKAKNPNLQIKIYSNDMKNTISSTIARQVSLARTMSTRNLIKKFGFDRKDVLIDLSTFPDIKEDIKNDSGFLLIQILK